MSHSTPLDSSDKEAQSAGRFRVILIALREEGIVYAMSLLSFLNGCLALLASMRRISPRLSSLITLDSLRFSRSASFLAGIVLIYLSLQLLRRKRVAFFMALVSYLVVMFGHAFYFHSWRTIIIPLASFGLLFAAQNEFRVRSDTGSLYQGIQFLILSIVITVVYGTVGFLLLDQRDFGQEFSVGQAVTRTYEEFTLSGNTDLHPRTRYAQWFISSLDTIGAVSMALTVYSFFRPLRYRFGALPYERELAHTILATYGEASEDFFKLWPEDKHFFFDSSRKGLIAYKVVHGIALGVGDPVGSGEAKKEIVGDFTRFCTENGWRPTFIHTSPRYSDLYTAHDLSLVKIGKEAIVNLQHFTTHTIRNKHFRNVCNRFEKAGYTAVYLQPPFDPSLLHRLEEISRSWLSLPGREEHGFMMGYFSQRYMNQCPLMVVRDKEGRVVAFANSIPTYDPYEANIDLFRYERGALPNINDYLLAQLIVELTRHGYERLNLGLSPLAGLDEGADRTLAQRALNFVYNNGDRLYSFQGLYRFKDKFEPQWEDRYIAYAGTQNTLLQVGVALYRAMRL